MNKKNPQLFRVGGIKLVRQKGRPMRPCKYWFIMGKIPTQEKS